MSLSYATDVRGSRYRFVTPCISSYSVTMNSAPEMFSALITRRDQIDAALSARCAPIFRVLRTHYARPVGSVLLTDAYSTGEGGVILHVEFPPDPAVHYYRALHVTLTIAECWLSGVHTPDDTVLLPIIIAGILSEVSGATDPSR